MAEYFENNEEVPILALEKINYSTPFVLIEIIDFYSNFKVIFSDNDCDAVINKYIMFKKMTKNPLLIINDYSKNIFENKNIHQEITKFCNNTIQITKL